jgi:beta-glucosidase
MTTTNSPALPPEDQQIYKNRLASVVDRVENLLALMTIDEKIGQITLVEENSIDPKDVSRFSIGAILSGGGNPPDNSPTGLLAMVKSYLDAARQTRLGIPQIYGLDAVHGHNNMRGAVIFPHNIGLGAARDTELVRRIGRATAVETYATGVRWNYAPTSPFPKTFAGAEPTRDSVRTLIWLPVSVRLIFRDCRAKTSPLLHLS